MEETAAVPLPSLPKRLIQVFFSPGELFAALREKPVWFGAMAVVALLVGLSMAFIPAEIWVETSRNALIERGQDVPPGFESSAGVIRIFSVLGAVIMTPVMMFILAGLVTLVFSFFLGDKGRYSQYLAVVTHASVITAVGTLALLPLKIAQGDPQMTLSVGTFFSFLEDGYFRNVLKMLDLVALWSYVVMAIGITKIDPRRSLGFAVSFFMAFALVFALIFGKFVQ